MTWGSQNTEQEAHEQLSYALDQGLNFLDTAEVLLHRVYDKTASRRLLSHRVSLFLVDGKYF